jgi:Fe-S-cluster containining protein
MTETEHIYVPMNIPMKNNQPAVNPQYENLENIAVHEISSAGRECGTCTKCCEGWLMADIEPEIIPKNRTAGSIGDIHEQHIGGGIGISPGRPCRFLNMDKDVNDGLGCTIYEHRPYEPCQRFKCAWLLDDKYIIPEWMKPNLSDIIISEKDWEGGRYWSVCETGQMIRGEVLNWLMIHCEEHQINVEYMVGGGLNYRGTQEFHDWMKDRTIIKTVKHEGRSRM